MNIRKKLNRSSFYMALISFVLFFFETVLFILSILFLIFLIPARRSVLIHDEMKQIALRKKSYKLMRR